MKVLKTPSLLLLFSLFLLSPLAQADTHTYIGPSPGDWNTSSNWSPSGVPGANDTAIINTDSNVTVGPNSSININPNGTLTNNGTLSLNPGGEGIETTIYSDNGAVTLTGSGTLYMNRPYNNGYGARLWGEPGFTNDTYHTIQGAGYVHAPITNYGAVIADNGLMLADRTITNATQNSTTGSVTVTDDGVLQLYNTFGGVSGGTITNGNIIKFGAGGFLADTQVQGGLLELMAGHSANFKGNVGLSSSTTVNITHASSYLYLSINPVLTNNGTINIDPGVGEARLQADVPATLTGTGKVVLKGDYPTNRLARFWVSNAADKITNDVGHTIQGGGEINAKILNNGTLKATNELYPAVDITTLRIDSGKPVTGTGTVAVEDRARLDLYANVTAGNFLMSQDAYLTVQAGIMIDLSKNFTFAQTVESHWSWLGSTALKFSGGGLLQALEIGGTDAGEVTSNYANTNFDLVKLVIGTGSHVFLTDSVNNGNRSGPEALYVDSLTLGSGAVLNLNLLHLYVWNNSANRYDLIGAGGYGDGTITNTAVPLPGSLLLLGTGLLGLGAVGWRRRKKS